jgi:hypothetical protein
MRLGGLQDAYSPSRGLGARVGPPALRWIAAGMGFVLGGTSIAGAGQWISGGSFDPAAGVPAYFLRYIAPGEPGQMTIRCTEVEGVTIDAGVTGDGPPPAGVKRETEITSTFRVFGVSTTPVAAFAAAGLPRMRGDNTIVVTVGGKEIDGFVKLLSSPLDHVEITIGDTTATVSLVGVAINIAGMSSGCPAWPR